MIEIVSCYANIELSPLDFTKVLKSMNEMGSKSLIWQSKVSILEISGITQFDNQILSWMSCYKIEGKESFTYKADVFVEDGDAFYVLNKDGYNRKIEMGIISMNRNGAVNKLIRYTQAFVKALNSSLDGRRVRHMDQKWYKTIENGNIDYKVTYEKSFMFSELIKEEVEATLELSESNNRKILLDIAKVNKLNKNDIRGDGKEFKLEGIKKFIEKGLIDAGYFVICRKNSLRLAFLKSKDEFNEKGYATSVCNNCGRKYSEELFQENYSLSSLGRKLTSGSQWMTILTTKILIDNGIPKNNIIWNLSDAGEEVDCVVEFKGKIWIFELKDRDFESGDAHPFIYRAQKFKADKIIVFTSTKVSDDAKKVFQKVSYGGSTTIDYKHPLYIEGIDSLKESIESLVMNESLLFAREKTQEISRNASVDLSPIFTKLFGKGVRENKGVFKDSYSIL